ncbi:hypothetical protein FB451DRAFT_1486237 [Mycena latifolia]|nr:hypothetical protein FB451DRAFT_1486237 [Mycena latifolia]
MEPMRRCGRPKGSKDGPQPADTPPRGRPRTKKAAESDSDGPFGYAIAYFWTLKANAADGSPEPPKKKVKLSELKRKRARAPAAPAHPNPGQRTNTGAGTSHGPSTHSATTNLALEFEQFFGTGVLTAAAEEMDRLEQEARTRGQAQSHRDPIPPQETSPLQTTPSTAELLKPAARRSNSHMFFSKREAFACDAEPEEKGMDTKNEEDETMPQNPVRRVEPSLSGEKAEGDARMAISVLPRYRTTAALRKGGREASSIFGTKNVHAPASFWIHPVEPAYEFPNSSLSLSFSDFFFAFLPVGPSILK